MSANNIQKNFPLTKWYVNGGASAETITSVRNIVCEPAVDFIEDGSDADASATFIEPRAERNDVTIECRDPRMLDLMKGEKGDLFWQEGAARGTVANFWLLNVAWAKDYNHNGMWDELRAYQLRGRGGDKLVS